MDTKPHFLIVGLFVIASLLAAGFFIVWLGNINNTQSYNRYSIYFPGSVNGLGVGEAVRYRGVHVGRVAEINLDYENPERIKIITEIDSRIPIREDTQASLKFQGITGIVFIELEGMSLDSPILTRQPGEKYPVIHGEESELSKMFTNAPEMIDSFTEAANNAAKLMSDENIESVTQTLKNVYAFTEMLDSHREDIASLLEESNLAMQNISRASKDITDITGNIEGDLINAIHYIKEASESITSVSQTIDTILSDNKDAIARFSGEGLEELTKFFSESRVAVQEIKELSQSLKNTPSKIILSPEYKGYKVAQ